MATFLLSSFRALRFGDWSTDSRRSRRADNIFSSSSRSYAAIADYRQAITFTFVSRYFQILMIAAARGQAFWHSHQRGRQLSFLPASRMAPAGY